MILLLFPEKRLNLILGVVHESHAGPVLCYLQKQFSKVLPSHANIIKVVSWISSNSIPKQWKSATKKKQQKNKLGGI